MEKSLGYVKKNSTKENFWAVSHKGETQVVRQIDGKENKEHGQMENSDGDEEQWRWILLGTSKEGTEICGSSQKAES